MLNSGLVNVYTFTWVRTSKHLLSNRRTDTMSLQQNAHSTAPESLLTSQDFTHSSNCCNVSVVLYNPIKWDYK